MLIMEEALHMWEQETYEKPLFLLFNIAMN